MTIGNAMTFIARGQKDVGLRRELNQAAHPSEVEKIMEKENLTFSGHDFDEAFHHLLTLCTDAEQADQLKEFKMWWSLITCGAESSSCSGQCSGCG